jgi:hypothetical protein
MSIGGISNTQHSGNIESTTLGSGENKISSHDPQDTSRVSDNLSLSDIAGGSIKVSDPLGFEVTQEKHSVLESIAERMDSDKDGTPDHLDRDPYGK